MIWLERAGKELRAKKGQEVFDREALGFCVKMVHRGHLHTASGDSKGRVLDQLELLDI